MLGALALLIGAEEISSQLEFNVCIDYNNVEPSKAVSAGFKAAGRHIADGDCSYIPNCNTLLASPVNLTTVRVSTGTSAVSTALAARECQILGGALFVASPGAAFESLVPYNVANSIATARTQPSSIQSWATALIARNHFSTLDSAMGLLSAVKLFGWRKIAILYISVEDDFVSTMEGLVSGNLGPLDANQSIAEGIEVQAFRIDTTHAEQVVSELQAFGTSIFVSVGCPAYHDDRTLSYFDKFIMEALKGGLLEPQYTWVGTHEMRRPSPFISSKTFQEWQSQLLFLELKPPLSPSVLQFYAQEVDLSMDFADSDTSAEYLLDFEVDFAAAYDMAWIAASAFSASAGSVGWAQNEFQPMEIKGLSGSRVFRSLTDIEDRFEYTLYLSSYASESQKVLGTISCYMCGNPEFEFASGISEFTWRDGTNYPSSIPESDILQSDGPFSFTLLSLTIIAVIGGLLIVLLSFVCLAYFRVHRHLKQVAAGVIDVESPIAKAVTLLKEFSTTCVVSASRRRRALSAAMALLNAENVHAPMLQDGDINKSNNDIMKFLMFNTEAPPNEKDKRSSTMSVESCERGILITGQAPREPQEGAILINDSEPKQSSEDDVPDVPEFDLSKMDLSLAEHMDILSGAGTDLFFDTLNFVRVSNTQHPLVAVGIRVVRSFQLRKSLVMDEAVLASFIAYIEEGYNDLPYHNAIHAADVLARVSAIIHADKICDPNSTKDSLLILSVILAAIVHDYHHPGLTNAFQIATDSAISREFNEQMVLENVSLHRSLAAMRQDRFNFLPKMSVNGKMELCSNIIKLVLATDMSRHFELVASFKSKIVSLVEEDIAAQQQPFALSPKRRLSVAIKSSTPPDLENGRLQLPPVTVAHKPLAAAMAKFDAKQKIAVLQMALKVADVGHMAAYFEAHADWSHRLEDEFFNQGDAERALGLEISPLMDRQKPGVTDPGNQMTFANVIVIPMLETWERAATSSGPMLLKEVHKNQGMWQQTRDKGLLT